jgi:hypothetical protein
VDGPESRDVAKSDIEGVALTRSAFDLIIPKIHLTLELKKNI